MVILPRYCKEISFYAAVPDCWICYLARKALFLWSCREFSRGGAGGRRFTSSGGCACAEEEGRLYFPLAHLLIAFKVSRQTRVKRLCAYVAIVGTVIGK
jgi:hypothetical protein